MFWIELIIVLAIIFIGVRVGGTFLAMAGGIGMFIMTFILHVTPSDPPITVILIMIAVICAAATMQACGGLDYLVRIAEKILRKNPKMITVLAPVVAYIFTFMCGTGHIVYSLLPVINEIAIETGVRPERPISASIVSSQQAITACPISAATVGILAFMAEATNYTKVNIFTLLIVCVPATLIGTVIAAIAVIKKGKELADDPEFQARVEAGLIEDFSKKVKEEKKVSKEAKISVTIFLIAMVGIVLLGAVSGLVPTLADGSKLPLTTVIEIFMLVAAAAMILLTKLDSNKVLDQPVFRTGMFAVVLAFGLCWLVNTFIGDQSSFITDNMSALTNKYPWIFIVAVFIVGAITTSQSSTTMIMIPIGIALGLPANVIVAGWIACSSNYFIPASGQCVATIPGTFCIGDGTNAAGTLTRWVRDTFYEEELKKERAGGENAYAVMAREAAEVEAGSEGLIILPYIYGERSPIQDAKASGMLFGLKGTHTRKQINRAALEAVGYSTLQHMILFDEMNLPPKSVITAGGGTKNAAWMQIICDMIGRQICIPKRYQCSAYGDAAMAALGDRRFRDFTELRDSLPKGKILVPNEKNHIYYKEHYKMFRDLYLNNKDMMHRI